MSILQKIPTILGAGGGSVPSWREYLQECEYIKTDGSSYIHTDLFYYNKKKFDIYIYCLNIKPSYYFGATNGTKSVNIYRNSNGVGYFGQTDSSFPQFSGATYKYHFYIDGTKYGIEGGQNQTIGGNWHIESGIYLFSNNGNNFAPENSIIYNDIVQEENFHLKSVYVKNGKEYIDNKGNICNAGIAGFVEINTGIFYTNDGGGTFSHGADINI